MYSSAQSQVHIESIKVQKLYFMIRDSTDNSNSKIQIKNPENQY
jgi:hypothetical protein